MQERHLVYSTDAQWKRSCGCANPIKRTREDGKVNIRFEKSGRKGKEVTVISGLPLDHERLLETARALKARLGTGGTVKGAEIELQGDQRKKTVLELRRNGFSV